MLKSFALHCLTCRVTRQGYSACWAVWSFLDSSRGCKALLRGRIEEGTLVQGIFAKIGPDLELRGGDLISSPVDSIVSQVSPKKSYGPNSVGKNYFSATPFSLLAKNATGGHNA